MSQKPKPPQRSEDAPGTSAAHQNMLWALAAGRCSFRECRQLLIRNQEILDAPYKLGQMAHIFAKRSGGPRPAPVDFPTEQINAYGNLILLCPNHHVEIDRDPNRYPHDLLHKMKANHETWISDRLRTEEFSSIQLESVIAWLAKESTAEPSTDFGVMLPREKMNLNGFSVQIRRHCQTGLLRMPEVEDFVRHRAKVERALPEKLLQPLRLRYSEMRDSNYSGDDIFVALWQYASGYSPEFTFNVAGLAVLMYFFIRCELFEKS